MLNSRNINSPEARNTNLANPFSQLLHNKAQKARKLAKVVNFDLLSFSLFFYGFNRNSEILFSDRSFELFGLAH